MLKAIRVAVSVGIVVWTVFVFLSSAGPDDVRQRTAAWMSLPVVRSLPGWLINVATLPWTLALTAMAIGIGVGWVQRGRQGRARRSSPAEALGARLTMTAYAIDNMSRIEANNAVLSELSVVIRKLSLRGFELPPSSPFFDRDRMSAYLHQVGRFLRENDEPTAKEIARQIVALWPRQDDRREAGLFG